MHSTSDLREQLIEAGLEVLSRYGAAELTVRRIAEAAGTSTMGVYSRFGSRNGMLDSIYQRGAELLKDAFAALPPAEPLRYIRDVPFAYRRFALNNPALYALMFERPLPDFDPSPERRQEALEATFYPLVETMRACFPETDPLKKAYLLWCTAHGLISIELTHRARRPLPGYFLDTMEDWEHMFAEGIEGVLSGLGG